MTREQAIEQLQKALQLTEQVAAMADCGEVSKIASLDAERLQLLKSVRSALPTLDDRSMAIVRDIAMLNDRTLGLMEHRRRAKGRELDMAAVGRRAVAAYAGVRMQR